MLKIIFKTFLILTIFGSGFFCYQKNCQAVGFGDVIINEIAWMGTINSANDEWLELRNISDHDIDLNGWSLIAQDGAPLINLSGAISANGYFLLERTDDTTVPNIKADVIYSGALGNNGEILGLRDRDKNLIDLVEAGAGWQAGDNVSKKTMEKMDNGGWQTSQNIGGTAKAINSVITTAAPLLLSEKQLATSTSSTAPVIASTTSAIISGANVSSIINKTIYKFGDVVINEFVADPTDNDTEWIEIYNTINKEIDLSNWTIEDGSKIKTNLSGVLGVDGNSRFKIISNPAGVLNNSGDLIILRDNSGNLIDQVAYGDWDDGNKNNNAPTASDPFSIARKFDGYNTFNNINDFTITKTPTKNISNIIYIEDEVSQETKSKFDFSNDIFISEILPNPIGDDAKSEFIEIYNAGSRDVNLAGWSLNNEDGEKIKFEKMATSTIIKSGEYLVFSRQQTKMVMKNDSGEIKLFQPLTDKPIQTVKYKDVKEGKGYNLILPIINGEKEYDWSETITRGAINIIKIINHQPKVDFDFPNKIIVGRQVVFDSSDTFDQDGDNLKFNWDFGDGIKLNLSSPEHTFLSSGVFTVSLIVSDGKNEVKKEKIVKVVDIGGKLIVNNSVKKNTTKVSKNKNKIKIKSQVAGIKISNGNILKTTLENIRQYKAGDFVKVKGKVVVEPGILGAQIFYIVGSPGLQIYNYKKEFPNLKIGDYVEVAGELSEVNGEQRLKTKKLADVKILEHQDAPVAQILSCDKVDEEYVAQLISVTGEITGKKGSMVYLDDGNDEIEVYLKRATGIKSASLIIGKTYTISGIVVKTQSGIKLMPRSSDDIIIQNQSTENENIFGNISTDNEWKLAGMDKKLELFKYLLIISFGIIILLIGLIIKTWKNKF